MDLRGSAGEKHVCKHVCSTGAFWLKLPLFLESIGFQEHLYNLRWTVFLHYGQVG